MKALPVPPLAQTLHGLEAAVTPLVDAETVAATRAAITAFADGDGPACQAALEACAQIEHAAGRSWLSDAWRDAYLSTRTPLTLTSNVTMHIDLDSPLRGWPRAADVVHRFAAAALRVLRGERDPMVDGRGQPLCPQQWTCVTGGLRLPGAGHDELLPGRWEPAEREIVLTYRGRAAALTISDASGHPLSRARIEAALRALAESVLAAGPATLPFTAIGYLDSEHGAEVVAELRTEPHNAGLLDRLRDALFVVHLDDRPVADPAEYLRRSAFDSDQAWPGKPLTVQISLAEDANLSLHFEHTPMDGGTVQTLVQDVCALPTGESSLDSDTGESPAHVQVLDWKLSAEQIARLTDLQADYDQRAARYRVQIVPVPTPDLPALDFRVSPDALRQFVMLYAQLTTYGRVRSTYESVDMREYQAGRTECVRPNTAAAVRFVQALAAHGTDGDMDDDSAHDDSEDARLRELLQQALDAHRDQVKACKSGNGVERHLFGLATVAARHGYRMPILDDPGYRALTTDFLSTTSLGQQGAVMRVAFAPTSTGGIGIYYSSTADGLEFLVMQVAGEADRVDDAVAALRRGADLLWGLLSRLSTESTRKPVHPN